MESQYEKLLPFHAYLEDITSQFKYVTFHYLSSSWNNFANALKTLASIIAMPEGIMISPLQVQKESRPTHCYHIELAMEGDSNKVRLWYYDIWCILKHGLLFKWDNK